MKNIPADKVSTCIIIDNDPLSISLQRKVVEHVLTGSDVIEFLNAEEGFGYISHNYSPVSDKKTLLFLGTNIPISYRKVFMKNFFLLDEKIRRQIKVILVSPLFDIREVEFVSPGAYVSKSFSKPLTLASLQEVLRQSEEELENGRKVA